jgi:hypothetical protein
MQWPGRMAIRRILTAAASASVIVLTLATGAGPAQASALPISQCSTTSGVILAVDFAPWGGPVLRACGSTPTTGYDLLNEGGWKTSGTVHDGPGFICRISYSGYSGGTSYPTSAQDACVLTPPTSAYWSYWHANPGQSSWTYSNLGAESYKPEPGSVDAWVYGAGTAPSFSPASVRATNTSPPVSTTRPAPPPPVHTSAAPARTGASGGHGAATTAPGAPPKTAATTTTATAAATTGAADGASPTASSSPSAGQIQNANPTSATKPSAGSPVPLLIGVVIILLLGSGAGYTVWRRRRAR